MNAESKKDEIRLKYQTEIDTLREQLAFATD